MSRRQFRPPPRVGDGPPDEIRAMIEARDRSGKLLMTAQHFRFDGKAQALKAEIDHGALGTVYHARSWMLRRAAMPTRPGFLLRQHLLHPRHQRRG